MEYEIADASSLENLEVMVNKMIAEGFTPQGGIVSYVPAGERMLWGQNIAGCYFAQAMVRKAKK